MSDKDKAHYVAEIFQKKRLDALLRPIVGMNSGRNALLMKSNDRSLVSRGLSTSLSTYSCQRRNTMSTKCIYNLVFTGRPSKARYEQGATTCEEAAA